MEVECDSLCHFYFIPFLPTKTSGKMEAHLLHLSRSSHPPHLAYIHPTSKCDCCGWDKLISTWNMRRYEFTSDSRIRSLVSRGWESLCTSVSIGLWFRRLWCDSETVISFISMHSNFWFLCVIYFFQSLLPLKHISIVMINHLNKHINLLLLSLLTLFTKSSCSQL